MLRFRPKSSSSFLVIFVCICSFLVLIAINWRTGQHVESRFFHLLVPATSSNKDLCRLLLSTAALAFPSPRLINWGAQEDPDPYVTHVAKVGSTLKYLDRLGTERDDDLVLLVDGYDVWFQLRPELIVSRYYEVIDAANKRLEVQIGGNLMDEYDIYSTVLFGPDKICWPEDPRRTACWAVPQSTIPQFAFGPETDSRKYREQFRARWLNSGTVMGPVKDVRRVFKATLDRILQKDTDIISDQYHFANVFGEQEYWRKLISNESIVLNNEVFISEGLDGEGHLQNITYHTPEIKNGDVKEYHITIDYESKLFQTMAYYWKYIGWVAYDREDDFEQGIDSHEFSQFLPNDIVSSLEPFAFFSPTQNFTADDNAYDSRSRDPQPINRDIPKNAKWHDFEFGTNIITGQIFSLLHFTPPKELRERWWNRMWYFPFGRAIIYSGNVVDSRPLLRTRDGVEWRNYEPDDVSAEVIRGLGGAWSDVVSDDSDENWLSWNDLCIDHEAAVFQNVKEHKP